MAVKELPSKQELSKLLHYNPDTGLFSWVHGIRRGKPAFTATTAKGYKVGRFCKVMYYAHRLAWVMHYGKPPKGQIDHINGDPSDNRACNLRDVDGSTNIRNRGLQSNNTSGHTGVQWCKRRNRWKAVIVLGGKVRVIGLFRQKSDAIAARRNVAAENGFTERA